MNGTDDLLIRRMAIIIYVYETVCLGVMYAKF